MDLAFTNGLISDTGLTSLPGGFLAVPTAAMAAPTPPTPPGLPRPRLIGILVTTGTDFDTPLEGQTSLREAINWVNQQKSPKQLQVRFASNLGTVTVSGALPRIETNIFINGGTWNITILPDPDARTTFSLFQGNEDSKIQIAGLTLKNGSGLIAGGAVLASGNLTLQNCWILDNKARDGAGVFLRRQLDYSGLLVPG